MAQIQGLAAHAAGAELLNFRYDPGKLGLQEVEIAVSHCAVCHSDIHLVSNDWGISHYPFIPGHEIVGTVAAVGSEVHSLEIGQRVGLGWQSNSCGQCEWCLSGQENLCAASEGTCVHRHGGYADRVRANARFVVPIPDALGSEQAAPLLCGGITVYNPHADLHGVNPVIARWSSRHRRPRPSCHPVCVRLRRASHRVLHFAGQRSRRARVRRAPLCEQPRIESHERSGRLARLPADHRQRRPGLGNLLPGSAAQRNALVCRRSAVAGLRCTLSR